MSTKSTANSAGGFDLGGALRTWMMVALTLILTLLYCAALLGWVKPIADERMIGRLEPIIFVIIGYYFGRLPSQQNENALKEEIIRQTQKADAAQHAKEHTQEARESLEEKMKNVRASLLSFEIGIPIKNHFESQDKAAGPVKEDALRQSVAAAVNILNS